MGEKPCSLRPHIYSIISLQSIQGTMPKSAEVLIWEILFVEEEESLCGCLPSSPRALSPCWICHSLSNPHHSQQLLIKAAKVEFCARHSAKHGGCPCLAFLLSALNKVIETLCAVSVPQLWLGRTSSVDEVHLVAVHTKSTSGSRLLFLRENFPTFPPLVVEASR